MKKTSALIALAFLSGHAFAEDKAFSVTLGAKFTNIEEPELEYAYLTDQDDKVLSTDYGDGDALNLDVTANLAELGLIETPIKVGVRYQTTDASGDDRYGRFDDPADLCNVEPLLGLIDDCWNEAQIDIDTELSSFTLYGEMDFALNDTMTLTPRAGIQKLDYSEERYIAYLYDGGVSNFINDDTTFEDTGIMLGTDFKHDLGSFFWGAGIELAFFDDEREREVYDVERDWPSGTFSQDDRGSEKEDVKVTSMVIGLEVGKEFMISKMPLVVALNMDLSSLSNLVDTRNTQDNNFTPGERGERKEDFETLSYGLSLGTSF